MTDRLTRRALLTGATAGASAHDNEHISSAVVSVLPAHIDAVSARLSSLPGVEIHHRTDSKLVAVLEGPGSGALGAMLADISSWPGVLSANMVFEQRLD
ncbi:chaperone NapD [Tardiphaga sp. 709]|uniref:chaperone NapD n=1 Tax=unclassified Tardiphaga TaxID=2631404 RepID=UPI0028EA8FD6|nr:chaperone NapD [Tardiphaga sp. 709]WNV09898.1 chaperone NapD [Tardiphaga sp. 709]